MYYLDLVWQFFRASTQQELAYRSNFFIRVFYSLLSLLSGVVGLWALYSQVDLIHGWDMPSALALLGVYLLLGALKEHVGDLAIVHRHHSIRQNEAPGGSNLCVVLA